LVSDNPCHCQQTPIGEYGRFDISWNGGGTNDTRLSNWLDPSPSTGQMTLDGLFYCDYTILTGTQTSKKIVCTIMTLQNVIVPSGVKLDIRALENITINGLTINTGGTLELDCSGSVKIDYGTFKVETGATFIIK